MTLYSKFDGGSTRERIDSILQYVQSTEKDTYIMGVGSLSYMTKLDQDDLRYEVQHVMDLRDESILWYLANEENPLELICNGTLWKSIIL